MSEIKQMYLNAYYGQHFVEAEMPAKEIIGDVKADTVKAAYNKGKKSNRA